MKIVKRVHQHDMLPPFYGVAWMEYNSPAVICLPIPFNAVAALLRAGWLLLRYGRHSIPIHPAAAYRAGMKAAAGKAMCPMCQQFRNYENPEN